MKIRIFLCHGYLFVNSPKLDMSDTFTGKKLAIFISLGIFATGLASSATVKSNSEWLSGNFNGTTADKPAQGNLSLGYPNGSLDDKSTAFWRFDDTLMDFSGDGALSISSKDIGYSQGVFGTSALELNASKEPYAEYSNELFPERNRFTLSGWIKTSSNEEDKIIIEQSLGSDEGIIFLVDNYFGSDRLSLYVKSTQREIQRFRTDSSLNKDEWYHVAATYNSSNVSLYIDGEKQVLVDEGQSSATYNRSSQDILIGASSEIPGGTYYNGTIDELRIFNESLGPDEVKSEYLFGTPYKANYRSKEFSYDQPRKWEYVKTSSNISQDTDANITFQVSDDGFATIKDSESVNLQGGRELHQLDIQDASEARIVVKGSTTNVTETWVVESVEAEYFRDFQVNSISINESEPVEGRPLGINVNVSNNEPDFAETNVRLVAEKYRNDTGWEPVEIEDQTFSSNGFDSSILNYDIVPDQGPQRVKLTADPLDNFNETNESNNKNSTLFDVPLYGTIYGNTDMTVKVSDKEDVFYRYQESDETGTMYFVDSEVSPSFSNLKPLGDHQALGVADEALSSTGFNDSVQEVWGDGSSIRRTECFFVSGSDLCDVPVTNSTEDSFFDTGITYDGGPTYSKQDPLVFLSDMAVSRQGSFGNYDYEAKIPSTLSETQGSTDRLSVYMEIE